jgi:hypothetical protein
MTSAAAAAGAPISGAGASNEGISKDLREGIEGISNEGIDGISNEGVEGISPTMPVLRDQDGCGYFKEDAGKLLVGWFEPVPQPWGMKGIPESFCFVSLPEDFEHIAPLVEAATHRMPLLAEGGEVLRIVGECIREEFAERNERPDEDDGRDDESRVASAW